MKKFVMVLLVLAVVGSSAFAFDILSFPPPLEGGGKLMVDLGIGYAGWGTYSGWKMKVPPLVATVEFALPVNVPISVGGLFSFSQYTWDWNVYGYSSAHKWTHTYMIFAALANWHWGFDVKWMDVYTGLNIGYQSYSSKYDGPDKDYASRYYSWDYSGIYWGTQVGIHFYFTDVIGLALEVGYPIYAKAALALKFL